MNTRFCTLFLALVLSIVLCGSSAFAAGKVVITYKPFPTGSPQLLPDETVFGPVWVTAPDHIHKIVKKKPITYEFLFWDVGGSSGTSRKVAVAPHGKDTFATAWYLQTGGGGSCTPNCSVTTWAFSLNKDMVISGVTPISSVTPPGLWTSPSTTVSTMTTSPSVMITARASLPPLVPLPTFVQWLEPATSFTLTVSADTDGYGIALYRSVMPPIKPHCPPGAPPEYTCY